MEEKIVAPNHVCPNCGSDALYFEKVAASGFFVDKETILGCKTCGETHSLSS